MKTSWRMLPLALAVAASGVEAHHSFAIFDFDTTIEFEGVVESVKFRNPHIEMTLKVVTEAGEERVIDYIEGAPANMLVRNGITPAKIRPGTLIHTVASPLIEDPGKYFLRRIRTADGTEYGI